MTRTIAYLYDGHDDAVATVRDLEARLPHNDISIVANNSANRHDMKTKEGDVAAGAGTGASIGAAVGGGAGLLAGLGMLAIPGIGPVVAAGWLAATLAGAAAGAGVGAVSGGLIEAMTAAGVAPDDADLYAESVRRGGTFVIARVDDDQVDIVETIMRRHHPVDAGERRTTLRAEGWKVFDPKAAPYRPVNVADRDMPGGTRVG